MQGLFHLEGFDTCSQHADNPADDVVLKREEIAELPVKSFGPERYSISSMNEARGDADALVRPADAAANQILGIEPARPALARLGMLPHRCLGDDRKVGETGKLGCQIFRKSSGEVKALRIAAGLFERQNGDRGLGPANGNG
jgi:hypothetical protein